MKGIFLKATKCGISFSLALPFVVVVMRNKKIKEDRNICEPAATKWCEMSRLREKKPEIKSERKGER